MQQLQLLPAIDIQSGQVIQSKNLSTSGITSSPQQVIEYFVSKELMEETREHVGEESSAVSIRGIELRDVSFTYPDRQDRMAVENLTLSVMPGQRIAFIGESGSGKSTTAQKIKEFYNQISNLTLKHFDLKKYFSCLSKTRR